VGETSDDDGKRLTVSEHCDRLALAGMLGTEHGFTCLVRLPAARRLHAWDSALAAMGRLEETVW